MTDNPRRPPGYSARWRAGVVLAGLTISLGLGIIAIQGRPSALEAFDNAFLDEYQKLFASGRPAQKIVIVDIDDQSLASAGQWPWPRYRIGTLVRRIADQRAAAIGIDILFSEPDGTSLDTIQKTFEREFGAKLRFSGAPNGLWDNDAYLGSVLASAGAVGAQYFFFDYQTKWAQPIESHPPINGQTTFLTLQDASGVLTNTEEISSRLRFSGFLNSQPDSDGIVRRIPLLIGHAGAIFPNLALATVMRSLRIDSASIESTRNGPVIRVGSHLIPIDERGYALPTWNGRPYLYPSISAIDVLNGAAPDAKLAGKIVILGSSAAALHDVHSTVFDFQFPGVALQAMAAEDIVTDGFAREPSWRRIVIPVTCVGTGLLLALLFIRTREPLRLLAGSASLILCLVLASLYLFFSERLFLSPAAPVLAGAALSAIFLGVRLIVEKSKADEGDRSLVTERRANEEHIRRLAYFDSLTELPNRSLFLEKLDREISKSLRQRSRFGVLFMDLDGFKNINDTMGHAIGDICLKETADRLRRGLRPSDELSRAGPADTEIQLARLGGDEFTALLLDIARPDDAWIAANRLREIMQRPIVVDGRDALLTVSIGIAIYPDDGVDSSELLKHADTAMYHAKNQGRNNCQFYRASLTEQAVRRMNLSNELRHALERNEFHLVYQPQIAPGDGRIVSMEALLRWQHPSAGAIAPAEFIPLAEESGLIVPMGEWVLRTACAEAARWNRAGLPAHIAVNLSPIQFRSSNLLPTVRGCLDATGLPPDHLELEITEGAVMQDDGQTLATLLALHKAGVRIALDDFGTGYSSMNYIKRMPLDKLKIDRTFVKDLPAGEQDLAIVRAIVSLAKGLGLTTTAEGVETLEQANALMDLRCDLLQGFYYSRPVVTDKIPALMARNWARLDVAPDAGGSPGRRGAGAGAMLRR